MRASASSLRRASRTPIRGGETLRVLRFLDSLRYATLVDSLRTGGGEGLSSTIRELCRRSGLLDAFL